MSEHTKDTAHELKKTPLCDQHKIAGAKMVPFGGWLMPVSYEGVLAEHKTVREHCGLFDVSHMGEISVSGKGATDFVQYITINDVSKLKDGGGQYSALLKPDGGMIDDIIIYRLNPDRYFICVNASNCEKDYNWIREQAKTRSQVVVRNESGEWAQLAVQGPKSKAAVGILLGLNRQQIENLEYMSIMPVELFGRPCLLARSGYTGEWGYELYAPADIAKNCWQALLETSVSTGLKPIGLGARDTLRLESCYLLYGNDMDESVSPLEAGISWAVRLDKGDFLGRAALLKQKELGIPRTMVTFTMADDGIPRHGMDIYLGESKIGTVTSGSVLPTVGGAGGMALLQSGKTKTGDHIEIDIRGKRKLATIVKKPLYNAKVRS